ncbi:YceI family protein [Mycobacterium sp. 1274756.6]|uniref:YceI family protein n=1 Tax=Mycobacterium sp. 1274756.6 TaxID=1834076 RepID=UPI0007FFAEE2|nr:YceI family protein [Mycobacterium sp. 1274756.6]OBJ69943.1 S-adenosyl-L-methionine-dependent methyltransferase [Mycobacterium sp. 1274756.6]
MSDSAWTLDETDGQLLVHTDVTGPAAAFGHRLTIAVESWRARVRWRAGEPVEAALRADVGSLQVRRGDGGLSALTGPEKALVRFNALRVLGARSHPHIEFTATTVDPHPGGYRLAGTLQIHGVTRKQVIELHTEDFDEFWAMSARTELRQSEFGVRPYAMLLGTLRVADAVSVSFGATHAKTG